MTIAQIHLISLIVSMASITSAVFLNMVTWEKGDKDDSTGKRIHAILVVLSMWISGVSTGTFCALILIRLFFKGVL